MSYSSGYRRRSFSNYRSRGNRSRNHWGSKYSELASLFGTVLPKIRNAFLSLEDDALDELFSDYGSIHGENAEKYARKTYQDWKSSKTNLSGQTMERLVELVPPYLEPAQRLSLVKELASKHHVKGQNYKNVSVNLEAPSDGFKEIDAALRDMEHQDVLAHLPEGLMKAASWLYDDDVTAARSILAEATRAENNIVKASARKELELLKRTIATGQVKTASYSVEMPAGTLHVRAFTPQKTIGQIIKGWFS